MLYFEKVKAMFKTFKYLFLLTLIPFLYFSPMLTGEKIFVTGDLGFYFIPPKFLWVQLIKLYTIPFWNPHNYSGIPLIATLQSGVFYPPHILYLFLPFNLAWNWLIILHFVLAGIGMFKLASYIRISKKGSLISGMVFMLSGYLFSNHSQVSFLFAIAWLPLIIFNCLKFINNPEKKFLVTISILLSFQFFAGAPEISIISIVLTGFFIFFKPLVIDNNNKNIVSKTKSFILVLCLFFLLSSIQLLPFYELKTYSIRASGLSFEEATTWSLKGWDFLQFFMPGPIDYYVDEKSYWLKQSYLKSLYIGSIPLFLSFLYFISFNKERIFFLILLSISILLALGNATFIYKILHNIPIFNSIRYPVKFILIFFFVITLTAGYGLDILKDSFNCQKNKKIKIAIYSYLIISLISLIIFLIMCIFPEISYNIIDSFRNYLPNLEDSNKNFVYIKRFSIFNIFFGFILFLFIHSKGKAIFLDILIFVLIADLFLINFGHYKKATWSSFGDKDRLNKYEFLLKQQETARYFITPSTFKTFFITDIHTRLSFPFHFDSMTGLYSVTGNEVLEIKNYKIFRSLLNNPQSPERAKKLLYLAGVKYIITSERFDDRSTKALNLKMLKTDRIIDKDIYFYEFLSFAGRFILFYSAHFMSDENEIIKSLYSVNNDPQKALLISSRENKIETYPEGNGHIKLISYTPNKIVLHTQTDNDAFLYLSDTWYPGWKAYVDKEEKEIYRANLTFRAIKLPKGNHEIIFKYKPMSFYIGAILTLLGILLSIGLVLKYKKLIRKKE